MISCNRSTSHHLLSLAHHLLSLALVALALLGSGPGAARAGTGRIVDGKLNLGVMLTYREADPDSWKPLFEEASRLLFNATDGQLQIGTVRILGCSADKRDADVWILSGTGGALSTFLGLGGAGHIYLSQLHKSVTEPVNGQFGLVHEFGHYGFGLYDEYKGPPPPPQQQFAKGGIEEQTTESSPYQYCTTDQDSIACIMDGGSTILPNNMRTEFCTSADGILSTRHNSGTEVDGTFYQNAQEALNHESCWQTIARVRGLIPPQAVDTSDPPGLQPIDWQVAPELDRLVICLDRSFSMFARPDNITIAKQAAELVTDLLHERKTVTVDSSEVTIEGEHLGVVTFASDDSIPFPFREITGQATKDSAKAAIDAVRLAPASHPMSTDLALGLQTSLDQIRGEGGVPSCSEAILLLSDGGQSAGGDPRSIIPALQERGVRVYSLAIGEDADSSFMKELADSTRGTFYRINSAEEVSDIATKVAGDIRAAGTMQAVEDSISGDPESIGMLIDAFAEEGTFTLQWDLGTLDMTLVSPSGDVIDVGSADGRQDVEAARNGNLVYIRITNPEQGEWTANIIPVNVPGTSHYDLHLTEENQDVTVRASTDKQAYHYPEPIQLRCEVTAGVPVAGASVEATVDRPTGGPVSISLFDDGRIEHGDAWANDGVYDTIFSDFTSDGAYTFHIRVVNENGTGPDPDLPFIESGTVQEPIPPFVRLAQTSASVEGITGVIAGRLDFDPSTLNVQNPNGRVTCYIEVPPHTPDEIDLGTVRLNSTVAALAKPVTIGDHDGDGVSDLMVKFDRAATIDALADGMRQVVRVEGRLVTGEPFVARDTIAVKNPGSDSLVGVSPDTLVVGQTATISWQATPGRPIEYEGYLSVDGGMTWTPIFAGLQGATETQWTVAAPPSAIATILVQAVCPDGVVSQGQSGNFLITTAAAGVGGRSFATAFLGASPNPVTGSTTLKFSLASRADVRLAIFDVSGRLVRRLAEGAMETGNHQTIWDGANAAGHRVSSGIYLYKFEAGSYRRTGRLMLVR